MLPPCNNLTETAAKKPYPQINTNVLDSSIDVVAKFHINGNSRS